MLGANAKVGHLLRQGFNQGLYAKDGALLQPTETRMINTLIVGGGVAGLSAAWWLKKHGFHAFDLLELDECTGGNSVSGKNQASAYPWGAHYLPIPGPEADYVRTLLQDIGCIKGYSDEGQPIYDEYQLCFDPNERLYFQGKWREGLVPSHGISQNEQQQMTAFFEFAAQLKHKRGRDGRRAFVVPLELSSQDEEFLAWDRVSMGEFMRDRGWTSKHLHWYVNYCCRDDYGMSSEQVSAWAGLHYFASRIGEGMNAPSAAVLTWPEGNGYLAKKLAASVADHVKPNHLVYSIDTQQGHAEVLVLHTAKDKVISYQAEHVIFCAPRFVAPRVIKGYTLDVPMDYMPWVVANITLNRLPEGEGAHVAWDNVSFYSKSLGYIVANHQDIRTHKGEVVITYYLPLDQGSAVASRQMAYQKSHQDWVNLILPDLESMHPNITASITNMDVWVWGHGMIGPGVDRLWNTRRQLPHTFDNVEFAHSDMSGISVFEEAQYRGVEAAKKVLSQQAPLTTSEQTRT